jgi:hypothetical protein
MRSAYLHVALAFLLSSASALAQDKSRYTLFNPTPVDQLRSFNADRPTKSNVPYTVDAGHFQYEGDIVILNYDTTSTADTTITTWIIGNPTLKLGLLDNLDLQLNFSAYNSVQTINRSTASSMTQAGFGDVVTRFKLNLFGNEGGTALALMPYVKWPTAPQGVGNRFVEGGIAVPLALSLPLGFTTIVMPGFDYWKNPNDAGYHANFPTLINVNRELLPGLTGYAEIYANWSTHRDVRDVYTLDFALAWNPKPNFQLDIGVNIGLVPAAIPWQLYVGVAQRF